MATLLVIHVMSSCCRKRDRMITITGVRIYDWGVIFVRQRCFHTMPADYLCNAIDATGSFGSMSMMYEYSLLENPMTLMYDDSTL